MDMQILALLEMELDARDIDWKPLNEWYDETERLVGKTE